MPRGAITLRYNGISKQIACDAGVFLPFSNHLPEELKTYKAIWDTGATDCAITKKVIDELRLKPIDKKEISTSNGIRVADVYLIDLVLLPSNMLIPGVRASDVEIQGGDILIGMDVMSLGDLAITNHQGKTHMSFCIPSLSSIDFVPPTERLNRSEMSNVNKGKKNVKRNRRKKKK